MRVISKKTKYALRALYYLAREYGEGPVLVAKLAEAEAIPKEFLGLILLTLKSSGVVESKSGRGGGYHLIKAPQRITIGSIVRLMEGPLAPLPCASETAFHPCEECLDAENCGTRVVMRQVRDATARILDGTTLADVLACLEAGEHHAQPFGKVIP